MRLSFYAKKLLLLQIFLTTVLCLYFIILEAHLNFIENLPNSTPLHRQTHLFDNSCKFAWTEPLDSTLKKHAKFPKKLQCKTDVLEFFERNPATGEFKLKPSNYSTNLECTVNELIGGLKPRASHYKNENNETFFPQVGKLFWINSNNFLISCFQNESRVYQKAFMGLKLDQTNSLYKQGSLHVSASSFPPDSSNITSFSISILVFDSTSRSQFSRHLTRTLKLMKDLGTVVFEAYNKVGDNSAVNMVPILASELKETFHLNDLDVDGDVNIQKILPSKAKLNPDEINWIWKQLDKNYITMFNDDIMHTQRGLFHYPPDTFQPGFSESPAMFYYRPYYNYLYEYLKNFWRKCLNGDFLTEKFIDTWFRFENVFSNRPHFGFNFLASLTHDDPNNLNLLDDVMFDRISSLNQSKSLESTFLIIMGDHGNRIHPLNRYTFAGKVEERAPLLSILIPSRFREKFPEKSKALEANSQRFISNFDLRETLLDILGIRSDGRRGVSLFKHQDPSKSCQENNVISNHCLCMVDASNDLAANPPIDKLMTVLANYISNHNISDCFLMNTLICSNVSEVVMPNNYVQTWARTKISDKEVKRLKKRFSPIVYAYLTCSMKSASLNEITIDTQFRIVQDTQSFKIAYPPRLTTMGNCSFYSFPVDYCNCLRDIT